MPSMKKKTYSKISKSKLSKKTQTLHKYKLQIQGGELLGEGSYGCVLSTIIDCESGCFEKTDKKYKVAKIFFDTYEAKKEFDETTHLKILFNTQLDKLKKYTIIPDKMCTVDKNSLCEDVKTELSNNCKFTMKKAEDDYGEPNWDSLVQLLYFDRGVTLKSFWNEEKDVHNVKEPFKLLIKQFIHLFEGLNTVFLKNKLIHYDIKPINIIVDAAKITEPKYIDFGLMRTFDSSENMIPQTTTYPYWPPETYHQLNGYDNDKLSKLLKHVVNENFLKNLDAKSQTVLLDIQSIIDNFFDEYLKLQTSSFIQVGKNLQIDKLEQHVARDVISKKLNAMSHDFHQLKPNVYTEEDIKADKTKWNASKFGRLGMKNPTPLETTLITDIKQASDLFNKVIFTGIDFGKIDIYSLGVSLFEILEIVSEKSYNVNETQMNAMKTIAKEAMATKPNERPSAVEIINKLKELSNTYNSNSLFSNNLSSTNTKRNSMKNPSFDFGSNKKIDVTPNLFGKQLGGKNKQKLTKIQKK